jgi:hypothetical protein
MNPQEGIGSPKRFNILNALRVIILLGSPETSNEKGFSLDLFSRNHFGSLPAFR